MNDVLIIEQVYPCRSYCFTRIGRKDLLTLEWLNNEFPKLLQNYSDGMSLAVGDILVWKTADANSEYYPVHKQGSHVIFEKIQYSFHAGVYEGDGFVSDVALLDGGLPLVIRERRLVQLSRPDFYLRIQNNFSKE